MKKGDIEGCDEEIDRRRDAAREVGSKANMRRAWFLALDSDIAHVRLSADRFCTVFPKSGGCWGFYLDPLVVRIQPVVVGFGKEGA